MDKIYFVGNKDKVKPEFPKDLNFIIKVSKDDQNRIVLNSESVISTSLRNNKIRKKEYFARCIINEKENDMRWRFYGAKYPKKGHSQYYLSGIRGCKKFIYGIASCIEVAKKSVSNKELGCLKSEEYDYSFLETFNNKYTIVEGTEEQLTSML